MTVKTAPSILSADANEVNIGNLIKVKKTDSGDVTVNTYKTCNRTGKTKC